MAGIELLDYVQDVLCGLNVREYNYRDLWTMTPVEEMIAEQDRDTDLLIIPFAVLIHDDGLDYDEDGNAYFDDYPSDNLASSHFTERGAEIQAAHFENAGVEAWRISIEHDYPAYRYELKYHPMQI